MPYHHARSNVCFSNAVLSGLAENWFGVYVAGVDRTPDGQTLDSFRIAFNLDGGSSVCTMAFGGAQPPEYADLVVRLGRSVDDVFWGGTILHENMTFLGQRQKWAVQAPDWTWLLNRYEPVTAEYYTMSYNAILARILAGTNGGFRVGHCPNSLGTIAHIRFVHEPVASAISRLARAARAYFRILPSKHIDMAQTFEDGNPVSITNATHAWVMRYTRNAASTANRIRLLGRDARLVSVVGVGATVITVDDASTFNPTGGKAWAFGSGDITYTGTNLATEGAHQLTGVTGVTTWLEANTAIAPLAVVEDVAAQAALATALGSGRSGIATSVIAEDLNDPEIRGRAQAYLDFFKISMPTIGFEIADVQFKVGKLATVNITSPITVNDAFRIQSVTLRPGDNCTTASPRLIAQVEARIGRRADILDVFVRR